MSYEAQELASSHREILRLKVLGLSNLEVAEQLGVTPQTVCNVHRSSLGRQHIESLQTGRDNSVVQIREELEEMLPLALAAYEEVLAKKVDTSPMQRIKVASEVMDRTGYGRIQKVVTANAANFATTEDIEQIKATAMARIKALDVTAKEITDES